jgi:hypothetical protein
MRHYPSPPSDIDPRSTSSLDKKNLCRQVGPPALVCPPLRSHPSSRQFSPIRSGGRRSSEISSVAPKSWCAASRSRSKAPWQAPASRCASSRSRSAASDLQPRPTPQVTLCPCSEATVHALDLLAAHAHHHGSSSTPNAPSSSATPCPGPPSLA